MSELPGRPRVLFLSQVLPHPLDSGPKIRAYHVLRRLARSYEVTLVSFVRGDEPEASIRHLATICEAVHRVPIRRLRARDLIDLALALLLGQSWLIRRDRRRDMSDLLRRLESESFDALHCDQLWMAPYGQRMRSPARVLDLHNATFLILERMADEEPRRLRRLLLRREARKVAEVERELLGSGSFAQVFFVSREDRAALLDGGVELGDTRQAVLPIAVDASAIEPVNTVEAPHRVTFLGTMYWPPNADGARWFAREVWPIVLAARPEARFTIVGKRPPRDLERLADEPEAGIELTGYVEDLEPILSETGVYVVPLLAGGGMRVKILDAWAWGLPVVSTSVGAEGLELGAGKGIRIADAPEEMAAAVIELLTHPASRVALGAAGRETVLREYDVSRSYAAIDAAYAEILSPRLEAGMREAQG